MHGVCMFVRACHAFTTMNDTELLINNAWRVCVCVCVCEGLPRFQVHERHGAVHLWCMVCVWVCVFVRACHAFTFMNNTELFINNAWWLCWCRWGCFCVCVLVFLAFWVCLCLCLSIWLWVCRSAGIGCECEWVWACACACGCGCGYCVGVVWVWARVFSFTWTVLTYYTWIVCYIYICQSHQSHSTTKRNYCSSIS